MSWRKAPSRTRCGACQQAREPARLTAAPAGSGVAAIEAIADANDSLTGAFSYSSGTVASPDTTVTVDNSGGTVSVTDTHNTIKVTH
jgi:hypothetical protein